MNTATREALAQFSSLANWGGLGHPNDMERFWQFTIVAHREGDTHIPFDDFSAVVSANCTDEERVHKMYSKYEDAMELLNVQRDYGE